MKQFLLLELSLFNFPISLDYKIDLRVYWFLSIIKLYTWFFYYEAVIILRTIYV